MLFHIILREIRSNILSLRMFLALILALTVFGLGTFIFVVNYQIEQKICEHSRQNEIGRMKAAAAESLTFLAHRGLNLDFGPKSNSFISNSREDNLPKRFSYDSFKVERFFTWPGGNPLTDS
jgi:hypothetical protein